MVEQTVSILEQYPLEVRNVRKGRGNWIVNCKEGDFVLKEYSGNREKAALQKELTGRICSETGVLAQEIVANGEGELLSKGPDERLYALQTYMEGRECNIKVLSECEHAVSVMACMHRGMCLEGTDVENYSLQREFAKRNMELRRIRRYLKEKRKKNEFERFISSYFNAFLEKALEVEENWSHYEKYCLPDGGHQFFCHGDYQHHNVWMNYGDTMILQFERFAPDLPCRDLYLFMRKLLEKNNWEPESGRTILRAYEKERELTFAERISMIYRFSYPEKFWKIANYYFNSRKSFMPEKNMEKLQKLLEQEDAKERFIGDVLQRFI